jgi:ABC-2 type transport system ATP-binding protein
VSDNAVEARGLIKRFGSFTALDGLSLTVARGAFYALLGPNGAGKSTTIALLTGLYSPDAGTIQVLGRPLPSGALEVKARIGLVPEELMLFERLSGRQHLSFVAQMQGLSRDEAEHRASELLELTELKGKENALVAEYSKGMRRRLAIASALVHAPQMVFLDEPFEGIDVMAAGIIRELLQDLSRRGVTLLLTTHVLEIADRLSTHACFVRGGRVLDQGPVPELLDRHRSPSLEGAFRAVIGTPAAAAARLSFFPSATP